MAGLGGGDAGGISADERDFTKIVIPHGDEIAVADVAGVAIAIGEEGGFIERGGDVAGEEPFFAAAGRSDGGVGFLMGDPAATAIIAIEEPR